MFSGHLEAACQLKQISLTITGQYKIQTCFSCGRLKISRFAAHLPPRNLFFCHLYMIILHTSLSMKYLSLFSAITCGRQFDCCLSVLPQTVVQALQIHGSSLSRETLKHVTPAKMFANLYIGAKKHTRVKVMLAELRKNKNC